MDGLHYALLAVRGLPQGFGIKYIEFPMANSANPERSYKEL